MQDLRLVLLLVGGIAIVALVIHGLWISRRSSHSQAHEPSAISAMRDTDGFDQDGIGEVRVVHTDHSSESALKTSGGSTDGAPKIHVQNESNTADFLSMPEHMMQRTSSDGSQGQYDQEVFVINIMSRSGQQLQGEALQVALKQQGFQFGDMSLFHLYEDHESGGECLFSLINMVQPGAFDSDNLQSLETPGVSLFMQIPKNSKALACWELMLEHAERLADALDAELMDAQRHVLSDDYIEQCRTQLRAIDAARLAV